MTQTLTPAERDALRAQYKAGGLAGRAAIEKHPCYWGECEGECGTVLFLGDQTYVYEESVTSCASCAPTWRQTKADFEENPTWFCAMADDPEAARAKLRAEIAAHEAAGTLDEPHTWEL